MVRMWQGDRLWLAFAAMACLTWAALLAFLVIRAKAFLLPERAMGARGVFRPALLAMRGRSRPTNNSSGVPVSPLSGRRRRADDAIPAEEAEQAAAVGEMDNAVPIGEVERAAAIDEVEHPASASDIRSDLAAAVWPTQGGAAAPGNLALRP